MGMTWPRGRVDPAWAQAKLQWAHHHSSAVPDDNGLESSPVQLLELELPIRPVWWGGVFILL